MKIGLIKLFVITADHTSPKSIDTKYQNKIGRYSIPMLFYTPDGSLIGEKKLLHSILILCLLF